MNETQTRIAAAVAARGYREGWTDQQFAARQVAKLQEEVGELAACTFDASTMPGLGVWALVADDAGRYARRAFDNRENWGMAGVYEEAAQAELADVFVVVMVLADALGFDVAAAALAKAERDVRRGVRGG